MRERDFLVIMSGPTSAAASPAPADPIGDGLRADVVAYWKMDEASGTRVDATGNGHDLSVIGTVSGVDGKLGNAARFVLADSNGLKLIGDVAFQSFGMQDATVCMWVKLRGFTGGEQYCFDRSGAGNPFNTNDYFLMINSGKHIVLDIFNDVQDEIGYIETASDFPLNEYVFVVAYIDSENLKVGLSINNSMSTSDFFGTPSAAQIYADSATSIGASVFYGTPNTASYQSQCDQDEIGFWKRVLTPEEITYLYNSGAGRSLY